jgi:hypothetical protein
MEGGWDEVVVPVKNNVKIREGMDKGMDEGLDGQKLEVRTGVREDLYLDLLIAVWI